jgi:hypothetical protein
MCKRAKLTSIAAGLPCGSLYNLWRNWSVWLAVGRHRARRDYGLRRGARRSQSARRWAQVRHRRLGLREGTALVAVGTVLGFWGAMALAKMVSALANMLVDALRVGTTDVCLLVGTPLLLAAVAMLACYVRRAKRLTWIR